MTVEVQSERDDADDEAFARLLLDSARADAIASAATLDAWARFSGAAGAMAVGAGVSVGPSVFARAVRRASVKWLLVGAVGGSAAALSWVGVRRTPDAVQQPAPGEATVLVARPAPLVGASSSRIPPGDGSVVPSPGETARAGGVGSSTTGRHAPTTGRAAGGDGPRRLAANVHESASTLAAEIAALDAIRAAVAAKAFHHVTSLVGDYHREFPAGQLAADADALSLEALDAAGDREAVAASAARFLERYPNDPHAVRVRALGAR